MRELVEVVERVQDLLEEVDRFDEPARRVVFELLDAIDALHRPAVRQLGKRLDAKTLDKLKQQSPSITWLLEAYGSGMDLHKAADDALDTIRPYIKSHGGSVEVLGVDEGVVRLKMSGSCSGCTASTITLREGIESALIEHMPGYAGMEVEEDEGAPHPPPGPTLLQIGSKASAR
ncbi:MAG: NifU family protein [Actinobacteria bacterium]|nr:NifU family protein [Actinomycetota bacterium]